MGATALLITGSCLIAVSLAATGGIWYLLMKKKKEIEQTYETEM